MSCIITQCIDASGHWAQLKTNKNKIYLQFCAFGVLDASNWWLLHSLLLNYIPPLYALRYSLTVTHWNKRPLLGPLSPSPFLPVTSWSHETCDHQTMIECKTSFRVVSFYDIVFTVSALPFRETALRRSGSKFYVSFNSQGPCPSIIVILFALLFLFRVQRSTVQQSPQ